MAHRRTFSARFPDMHHVALDSPPLTPMPNLAPFDFSRKPRAQWIRMTFLALFSLMAVSAYVLFLSPPVLHPIAFDHSDHPGPSRWTPDALRLAAMRNHRPPPPGTTTASRPQIRLNETEELGALSSFIASLPQNMIPQTIDASHPLDPQLVLDFDTRGPHAEEELAAVMDDVWARNPVMLYSKIHSPISREIKQTLASLYLKPAPTIVEVDERPDEHVLTPLLFRLTKQRELPILLVGGKVVGAPKDIKELAVLGTLQSAITAAGGVVDGARKKKAKKL
ncbi:uncharacterized protein BXZ73DRAFT_41357 [Epithele typhae]|uniref:uncharacterized protein n=1 Tax=Epithele typhae TaxID=378194 RepID=UPI002008DCA4|nr:uncharacterized protein BXZ73DRAFT_41357 [Epithele typhae]KAH9942384.1 hypothetical protein BXZ73DRAFT_41357 [Epithele typhae]